MDFVELISQLEECKFLRLFRYLVDSKDGFVLDGFPKPAVPLDLPNAELHAKIGGHIGSMQSWAATWFFQIAHLPSNLWVPKITSDFVLQRLTQAFRDLKSRPDLLRTLQGALDHS